ncbi:hypothetical protein F4677DRAFT_441587 [Hypoxylon crocopeplum]|nr:hypothetical protein F4677DRAFT_441587 [Hypoxylon crocopeplum]
MSQQRFPSFDPYRVLGLSNDADARTIKVTYRRLCLQYHPDKAGPQSHEQFVQIQDAYELLSDEARRSWYDRVAKNPKRRASRKGPKPPGAGKSEKKEKNKDNEEDQYENSESEEEDRKEPRRTQRRWYEKESKKNPPKQANVEFRRRIWTTNAIKKVSEDLDSLDTGFNALSKRVAKLVQKSEPTWVALQRILGEVAKGKSEIAAIAKQVTEVAQGHWRNKPEIRDIIATFYKLQSRVGVMKEKLSKLDGTVKALESISEESADREERKRHLKRLFRVQAL